MTGNALQDPAFHLEDVAVEEFQRDGCTIVRGLCPPEEVAEIRVAVAELVGKMSTGVRSLGERDTYGQAFLQCENLWTRSEIIKEFTLSPRFAAVAARLARASAIRLYHDQALFKEPGGGLTPWHQDQGYWPFHGWGPLTMWMPLVDLSEEMGGSMSFVRGSCHRPVDDFPISDHSDHDVTSRVDIDQMGIAYYGAMAAGDATFHAGWTLHRANPNPTQTTREVMTVIYFPDGMVVQEPQNGRQESDLRRWLGGCRPGERAASPLTPIVFADSADSVAGAESR